MRYILYLSFAGAAINAFRFSLRSSRPRPFSPRFVKRDEGATWDGDESEEWKDPGGDSSSGGGGVRVPDAILDRLDEEVGGFVTLVAIKTYKTYLKSYNDELTQKFLSRYGDDEVTPDGLSIKTMLKRPWVDYFEKMIRTDALEYKILVRDLNGRGALKGILRGSPFNAQVKDRKRVHHYYIHKLEPRKVASALLTVREDVSTELLADLRCVRLENEEVKNYAENCLAHGHEYAVRLRKQTRMAEYGGSSTPLRDHTYKDAVDMVTRVALSWLEEDSRTDRVLERGLRVILDMQAQADTAFQTLPPQQRILAWYGQRTRLLEAAYLRALTERQQTAANAAAAAAAPGPPGTASHKDDLYRAMQRMLQYREAISEEVGRIVEGQNVFSRRFYKMIKDLGGFTKLDMSGSPKIYTVEEDEEAFADNLIHNSLERGSGGSGGGGDVGQEVSGPEPAPSPATSSASEGEEEEEGNLLDLDFSAPQGPVEM